MSDITSSSEFHETPTVNPFPPTAPIPIPGRRPACMEPLYIPPKGTLKFCLDMFKCDYMDKCPCRCTVCLRCVLKCMCHMPKHETRDPQNGWPMEGLKYLSLTALDICREKYVSGPKQHKNPHRFP